MLKDSLRAMAAQALVDSANVAPATHHYYHHWLSTSVAGGPGKYSDMLSWLGSWCDTQRHPVSRSVA